MERDTDSGVDIELQHPNVPRAEAPAPAPAAAGNIMLQLEDERAETTQQLLGAGGSEAAGDRGSRSSASASASADTKPSGGDSSEIANNGNGHGGDDGRGGASGGKKLEGISADYSDATTAREFKGQPLAFGPAIVHQTKVLLRKNWTLLMRFWPNTLVQIIIAPVVCLLILFFLQEADLANSTNAVPHPSPYAVEGVRRCSGYTAGDPCITVMYTPEDAFTTAVMSTFVQKNNLRVGSDNQFSLEATPLSTLTKPSGRLGVVAVPSADFIYDYTFKYPNYTSFGVSFVRDTTANTYQYQIWYNFTATANGSDPFGNQMVAMMRTMDEAVASQITGKQANFDVYIKDWPVSKPTAKAGTIVPTYGPVFFFAASMVNFIFVLNTLVQEKESRLYIAMEMMGMQPLAYWLSWFIINTGIVILASFWVTVFGYAFQFSFFVNANFAALWITFFLFQEAMLFFAFAVTTVCSTVRTAVMAGIFIFLIGLLFMAFVFTSNFIGYLWWDPSVDSQGIGWRLLMFIPFFNFGKVFIDISGFTTGKLDAVTETIVPGDGFPWSALYNPIPAKLLANPLSTPPAPVQSWYLLIMDIAVYGFFTWYLSNVIPNEYGYCRPFYFFLQPSYWMGGKTVKRAGVVNRDSPDEDEDVFAERSKAADPNDDSAIRVVNLRKVYQNSMFRSSPDDKVAVRDLCLTLKEGQVFALLGQNGAGKSTSMNILSGLTFATSGDAIIYGRSVHEEMSEIRKDLGVCPQHDILFGDLTAREHILLFAGIKNIPEDQIEDLIADRLEAVRLSKVANKVAKAYSGGMKRRLSMAISTIGDPKVIFLDEPTTGMDPVNRRHVWAFIQRMKRNRVIVLTSHSMEEVDVLGDKIAIMAQGRLYALGSSIHLKHKFGAGYRISLITNVTRMAEAKEMVTREFPEARLEDDSAGALIYQIPTDCVNRIPIFTRYLEEMIKKDGDNRLVREWGLSLTTLEEVFLKLIRMANPTNKSHAQLR